MPDQIQRPFPYCGTVKERYPEDSSRLCRKEFGLQWGVVLCRMCNRAPGSSRRRLVRPVLRVKEQQRKGGFTVPCYCCQGTPTSWHTEKRGLLPTVSNFTQKASILDATWLSGDAWFHQLGNFSSHNTRVDCCRSSCHSRRIRPTTESGRCGVSITYPRSWRHFLLDNCQHRCLTRNFLKIY